MTEVVEGLPLLLAFSAGLVATVNPCGFAMLPSFVAYFLGTEDDRFVHASAAHRALLGLGLGLALTVGFLAVFLTIGLVVSFGGRALLPLMPWGTLVVGVLMIGLGLWVASGRSLGLALPHVGPVRPGRSVGAIVLFGAGYAVASLGCTLPIFLVVVGSALTSSGPLAALLLFVAYGLGMGVVLAAVSLAAALCQSVLISRLRAVLPYVGRLSAAILIVAGIYLVAFELSSGILMS